MLLCLLGSYKWIRAKCLLLEPGGTDGPFWTFEINQLPASAQRRSSPRLEVPRATGWVLASWQSVSIPHTHNSSSVMDHTPYSTSSVCVCVFFSNDLEGGPLQRPSKASQYCDWMGTLKSFPVILALGVFIENSCLCYVNGAAFFVRRLKR